MKHPQHQAAALQQGEIAARYGEIAARYSEVWRDMHQGRGSNLLSVLLRDSAEHPALDRDVTGTGPGQDRDSRTSTAPLRPHPDVLPDRHRSGTG
eukprot:CAMPEP_0119368628 /NCGR_PEP_ID=MMETSP1334-20130426/15261_1 /TAXON_ID=127549 /ORGANISM="Calcidiscus leptoporus, Strain RCC1130" /LENGTH=94 /DNA_ID=CAMNT_0007385313 /DNA_START=83 /DNA_END=369 /DNA_ORIENTATION=-